MAMPRTTPSAVGVDARRILAFLDAAAERDLDLHSLMIARDGQVIAEGWWEPYSPDDIQLVYSCNKSFTATAAGFLVTDGVLDVSTKVLDHLPWQELETQRADVDPRWEELRLEHCLSMTVGHTDDAWVRLMPTFSPETDFIDTILGCPPDQAPGSVFSYNQVATYLAARVVENVAGDPLVEFLRRRFFEPLGVGPVDSHADPKGRALGFSGFHVRTEALLALSQLYLDEGRRGDEQLLDPAWVQRASRPYLTLHDAVTPAGDWEYGYGFSFWNASHGYRGDGAYGQFAIVLPQHRMVIAITSEIQELQDTLDAVWEHVLPAVDAAISADADDELARRLTTLELLPAASYQRVVLEEAMTVDRGSDGGERALPGDYHRATLEADGDGWLLTLEERGRRHAIAVGDSWPRTVLGSEESTLAVVARGGWVDDDQFVADVIAIQTPHRFTVTITRSTGDFRATFRRAPLGGTDPALIGLPGTGGRG